MLAKLFPPSKSYFSAIGSRLLTVIQSTNSLAVKSPLFASVKLCPGVVKFSVLDTHLSTESTKRAYWLQLCASFVAKDACVEGNFLKIWYILIIKRFPNAENAFVNVFVAVWMLGKSWFSENNHSVNFGWVRKSPDEKIQRVICDPFSCATGCSLETKAGIWSSLTGRAALSDQNWWNIRINVHTFLVWGNASSVFYLLPSG